MEGTKTFGFFKFALTYWSEVDSIERAAKGITCGENYSEKKKNLEHEFGEDCITRVTNLCALDDGYCYAYVTEDKEVIT